MLYLFTANRIKKLFPFFSRNYCLVNLHKRSSKVMEKAYFRHQDGDEQFHLNFLYGDEKRGVHRQFNFSRRNSETVGSLLARITTNVERAFLKKKKKRKGQIDEEEPNKSFSIQLIQNGSAVSNEKVCVDVIKSEHETFLQIVDNKYTITVNSPWISNMSLPTSALAGFPIYPLKFEGLCIDKKKCIFIWYVAKCTNPNIQTLDWELVGRGFIYSPSTSDIGKKLKLVCIPVNGSIEGPEMEIISKNNVEAGPGICPFENRFLYTQKRLSGDMLRVVSYNILADLYCDSDFTRNELFPYCPPYALNIDYRKQLFLKEILGYNGDIVCLQEVDMKIFENDLTQLLEANSYEGIFTKKGGEVTEGLACFFRNDRFRLVGKKSCILGEELKSPIFKDIWSLIEKNEPYVKRLGQRTTAVQAVAIQSLENLDEIILIGNTHFYFHPDADHVRIMQGGLTILWLCDLLEQLKKDMPGKRISLILCGDFNSVPECGVYKLYTTGFIPADFIDWRSNEAEAVSGVTLSQPLPMASACGIPAFTNFTAGFVDCLDFIYYNTQCFNVIQVVPFPTLEEVSQNTALPSVLFPSDHVALIADLQFR